MRQLAEHTRVVEKWRGFEKKVSEIAELLPLAEEDVSLEIEIEAEIEKTTSRLDKLE